MILDRLADNPSVPGATTGIYDATGVAKAGAPALAAAVANVQRGLAVCPGVSTPSVATTLEYPTQLATNTPTPLRLGCALDCLYLVTLNNGAGRPVVAARGALTGGADPTTVTLPKAKLAAGAYRVDVRLVNQVNPAPVVRQLSEPLVVQ